jgi:antirestriction protein
MAEYPRIYVADLAAYNNGILHGAWIDVHAGIEYLQQEIKKMLEGSPIPGAEEFAIHDYEFFQVHSIGEYDSLSYVCAVADFLTDFPEFGGALLNAVDNLEDARTIAEEGYCGLFASVADYAQELTEDGCQIPESIAGYVDYQAIGRDLELNGDVLTVEVGFEKVHIFNRV